MLDQHFMIDKELLQHIIEAANIKKKENILEIGPGTGNLTALLLQKAKHVYCIEKDKVLAKQLEEKFRGKNITIICDDAINSKFPECDKCVSNLPYTLCESLLWKFTRIKCASLVFVVPRKFTELLQGYTPSRLHLLIETFYTVEYLETIGKEAFNPQPKVESALIRITKKEETKSFLREFFSQYDKKTKNALKEILMKTGKTKSEALQEISLKLRPSLQEKNIINLSLREIEEIIKHYTLKEKQASTP